MLNQRYVRIQARYTGKTGKPVGLFAANWHILRAERFTEEDKALYLETDAWFNNNLPNPPFYSENAALNNPQKAITYFKTAALSKYEDKIFILMGLLEKYGTLYDVVFTNSVGEIIYEDEDQVAAV